MADAFSCFFLVKKLRGTTFLANSPIFVEVKSQVMMCMWTHQLNESLYDGKIRLVGMMPEIFGDLLAELF